ncbi:MAG: hypothetical protein QXD16_04820 [Sulfolobales archaeon]
MSFSKKTAGLVILMVCSGIILYYLLRKKAEEKPPSEREYSERIEYKRMKPAPAPPPETPPEKKRLMKPQPTDKPRYEKMPAPSEEMCYTTFMIPEKEVY